MFIRGFVILAALTASLAQPMVAAGTRDPDIADAKYQEFGAKFPFVLRIRVHKTQADGSKLYASASAVAIRPQWVVTAAHILDMQPTGGFIYPSGENKDGWPISIFITHGEFKKDDIVGWHDIALCRIQGDFGLDFYPAVYDKTEELNASVTMSGWGATGTFLTGFTHFDNIRRAGSNKITGIERGVLTCSPRRSGKSALEFLICPGDSGGGLFIGNDLAGIVSYISGSEKRGAPKARYGDSAAFTRISLYKEWLDTHIMLFDAIAAHAEKTKQENEQQQEQSDAKKQIGKED